MGVYWVFYGIRIGPWAIFPSQYLDPTFDSAWIACYLQRLERSYAIVNQITNGLSERDSNDALTAHVSFDRSLKLKQSMHRECK